jgi:sugar/nucleoside kinase (ribokinase family)
VAVLCVVGDLVEDVVVRVATAPARGTDTPAVISRSAGGSGANVAAAAARAGCPVRFVGRVGDDATGEHLAAGLAAAGVDVRVQREGTTGTIVVVVEPDGERTMLPDRGAAQELGPVDAHWANGVTWIHVPAYSLCAEPIGTSALEFIARARAGDARLSIDVSSVGVVSAFGPDRFGALFDELAPDVVLATRDEAELVSPHCPTLLVVKDGARPIVLRRADGSEEQVPVVAVEGVVDTTGAGDAFAGGFLAATIGGAAPAEAARRGATLAARTLTIAGARLE